MQKSICILIFLAGGLFLKAQANNYEYLKIDEKELNSNFAELQKFENFIEEHRGISLAEVKSNYPQALKRIDAHPGNFAGMKSTFRGGGETPLGIPPFIWGCVLGIIGLVIVAVIAEDRELTKQALYGCIVSTALSIGLQIALSLMDLSLFF